MHHQRIVTDLKFFVICPRLKRIRILFFEDKQDIHEQRYNQWISKSIYKNMLWTFEIEIQFVVLMQRWFQYFFMPINDSHYITLLGLFIGGPFCSFGSYAQTNKSYWRKLFEHCCISNKVPTSPSRLTVIYYSLFNQHLSSFLSSSSTTC